MYNIKKKIMYLLFDIKDLLQIINDNIRKQIELTEYYNYKYGFTIKLTYLDAHFMYNQEEIMKEKYKYLKKLNAFNNQKITDVNHMKKLEDLDASWNCGITDNGIKDLVNLKKLVASWNSEIKNINHMQKLEILNASFECGIDDNGIKELVNLKSLDACNNNKITDINHLKNLEELDASYDCGIGNNGIKNLVNIKILNAINNGKITKF